MNSVLSEEVYQLLEEECTRLNLSLVNLSKFKPTMVILILTVTQLQQSGMTSMGVDQYYLSKAHAENDSVSYLETVEQQLELLFGGEDGNEDQAVRQYLDEQDKRDSMLVGTMHLHGPDGILRMLKKKGYRVSPVG